MIEVLLADDHELFRDSLKVLLEQDKEISVVACARNGKEAFEMCRKYTPDIVLMDVFMPDYDGIEGLRLIKEENKKIKILMLTSINDDDGSYLFQALKYGADGYLSKDLKGYELINSIKCANTGITVMQKGLMSSVLRQLDIKGLDIGKEEMECNVELSDREKEYIKLLADGLSNKEIAAYFHLSEGSVKNILTQLLKKLNLRGRVQLVVYAMRNGLV
ncbi:MAG TPA: response regulator transcription factor [Acetivibrio sp.]|uniref:response regulator transcription factor n=1 Tax=Acetivibrio sp. TaxID=1872092 RepID=UPI002C073FA4|nr:response regulator transcription factor [Acetivibrio sp.]HOM02959.1 response regulator transcription factor [Acetivibrio sp.]